MGTVKLIFGLFSAGVVGLSLYTGGAGLIPFCMGLGTVRVDRDARGLRLRAIDAEAIHVVGYVLFAVVPMLLALGVVAFVIGVVASLVGCAGLRVDVRSDGRVTRISRRFCWVIPWRDARFEGLPDAFVDGWGDFADPAALYVAGRGGEDRIELGWSHRGNEGRADALAAEIVGWRPRA